MAASLMIEGIVLDLLWPHVHKRELMLRPGQGLLLQVPSLTMTSGREGVGTQW
jgi:hypothetical protein